MPTKQDIAALCETAWRARVVTAAAGVGLFDAVSDRPSSARTLAKRCRLEPRATEMVLNALVGLDLLRKVDAGYVAKPFVKRYLRSDSPDGMAWMLKHHNGLAHRWACLDEVIRRGGPVGPGHHNVTVDEGTNGFIRAMDDHSRQRAKVLAEFLSDEQPSTMLDIGGGSGAFCVGFCRRWPRLRATLFDRPGVLEVAGLIMRNTAVRKRITMVAGDLNIDPLPGRFDLVLLSNVIHSSPASDVRRWISKIHRATQPGGLVAIHDFLTNANHSKPARASVFGINMLVNTPAGRVYSHRELGQWLRRAGFVKIRSARPDGLPDEILLARRR